MYWWSLMLVSVLSIRWNCFGTWKQLECWNHSGTVEVFRLKTTTYSGYHRSFQVTLEPTCWRKTFYVKVCEFSIHSCKCSKDQSVLRCAFSLSLSWGSFMQRCRYALDNPLPCFHIWIASNTLKLDDRFPSINFQDEMVLGRMGLFRRRRWR